MMKEIFKSHKWLIRIFIPILLLFGIITYLYFTGSLYYLINLNWNFFIISLTKIEKWLLGSLIGVIIVSIFANLFSSFLYGFLFPSKDKEILENTVEIISGQEDIAKTLIETQTKIEEFFKNSNSDPRDIEKYLKELPIKNGKSETEAKIDEWYQERKITPEVKELLIVVVAVIFEQNRALSDEIFRLKSEGKTEVAISLENIQKHLQEGEASKIKEDYFSRKEQIITENILILKQSIIATESLYAYNETIDLYKELILVEASADNYFQFALFLQKLNYFAESANCYQQVLKILRVPESRNSIIDMQNIATSLNNLAIIQKTRNEFSQALENHKEAFKIRSDLAKNNPETYLPEVGMSLNNLAVLYREKNEVPQAIEKYKEALLIYRTLAITKPKTYLPFVATILNNLANIQTIKKEFPQALENFEEVLMIYRKLENEAPIVYLPFLASALNNMAILHKNKEEFSKAFEKYEEALRIRRDLANENPRVYNHQVAETLINLVVLHSQNNEFSQAIAKHKEALTIYKELAIESPKAYEIFYAQILIMGVHLLKRDKNDLKKAKDILEKYPDIYKAQKLLEQIKELEK